MSPVRKENPESGLFLEPSRSNSVRNSEALATRSVHRQRLYSEPESIRSSLVMRNVVVDGRRTSVRLEPVIWDALQSIARREEVTLHDLVSEINRKRTASGGLSTAIRAYVVIYLAAELRDMRSGRLFQDNQNSWEDTHPRRAKHLVD